MYMLNDQLACTSIEQHENWAVFVCEEGTSLSDMQALDGQAITVTNGEEDVAVFAGYSVCGTWSWEPDGLPRMRIVRELSDQTEAAITGLDANVSTARAIAEDAKQTAQSAMETAQEAGMPASVKAASVMYVNATALTNSQVGDVRELIEDFAPGAEYDKSLIRRYDGKYYRMAQDISSTTSTTYQPGTGTESLYTLIDLAPDGVRVWHMPTDATNSFALNEKCHYPDADGAVYVSKRDGNTSEPGTDEWWALDGAGE